MKRFLAEEGGQAVVEYILLLLAVITVMGLFVRGLRGTVVRAWRLWNHEIAAPCPGCEVPGDEPS